MKPKLYLINGPLGAGKTTFLRELLRQKAFTNARVIENEFASTSIDTHQLHDHQAEVQTIAGLCICCSTGDELVDALNMFAGSNDPVIIEATGVANSLKLIEKLASSGMLDKYDIGQAVFVLDAAEAHRDPNILQAHADEIRAADMILLSKEDLLSTEEKTALDQRIARLKPRAVRRIIHGKTSMDFMTNTSRIVHYFVDFDGEIQSHDSNTSFTVINMDDMPTEPSAVRTVWKVLSDKYDLTRMKGDFSDPSGVSWHVEATPAQCLVSKGNATSLQLVLIGKRAHEITRTNFEQEARR